MPKPVHKKAKTNVPGYICPTCNEPVPHPPGASRRPSVWHPECAPPIGDERRRERICPGCGKRHTIPPATSSSFCDGPNGKCKRVYIAHYTTADMKNTPRQCFCGEPEGKGRSARRFRLCARHEFYFGMMSAMRDADMQPYYTKQEIIDHLLTNLEDLPSKHYTPIQRYETVLPADQRSWTTLLPDRNPSNASRTATQTTTHTQDEEEEVDFA